MGGPRHHAPDNGTAGAVGVKKQLQMGGSESEGPYQSPTTLLEKKQKRKSRSGRDALRGNKKKSKVSVTLRRERVRTPDQPPGNGLKNGYQGVVRQIKRKPPFRGERKGKKKLDNEIAAGGKPGVGGFVRITHFGVG